MLPVLAGLGLTFILQNGKILKLFRSFLFNLSGFFKELFSCAMCLGFWCGMVTGLVYYQSILGTVFTGLAVSFLGLISSTFIKFLEHLYTREK